MLMNEAFLHYLWKFLKFEDATSQDGLVTTAGQSLQILKPGTPNNLAGPDFFNAHLRIDNQLWAGNVEIHLKSTHWYQHNHERDEAYHNVILHVVWEDDCDVFDKAGNAVPTLELRTRVSDALLQSYKNLLQREKVSFINCERDLAQIPDEVMESWLERIFFERLERKVLEIETQLEELQGDWEALLFRRLARSFGTLINAEAFEELAKAIPFHMVRKLSAQPGMLEPLLLGIAGLLPKDVLEPQIKKWQNDFQFAKSKFDLPETLHHRVQFFKLRPPNFPTLRLSQLATLYEQSPQLFNQIVPIQERSSFQKLFSIQSSSYWETHYTIGKSHSRKVKKLSSDFIDILLINTLIPVKFAFARSRGQEIEEEILKLMMQIPMEKNKLVTAFEQLHSFKKDALHSQALIQLKTNYCDPNKCLHCGIGNFLLRPG